MMDLPATLTDLQSALRAGKLSQAEVIRAQRERLLRLNNKFHCVVTAFDDLNDEPRPGDLAGIGLAHKDIFDTLERKPGLGRDSGTPVKGLPVALVIARLQDAGASQLAALSMAQYACGATGDNSRFQRCINPLNAKAAVGGSSSGSAVAVASEMAYGSLGTDTAGSVRIPAASCALLGLKTTHGLIPSEGVFPLASSLDSIGLLTRSAADAEALLSAIVGKNQLPAATAAPRLKAWLPATGLHSSVATALEQFALAHAAQFTLGFTNQHRLLTALSEIILHHEAAQTHHDELLEGGLPPLVEAVAMMGLILPKPWYDAALRERAKHARAFANEYFLDADILMVPALSHPVPDWSRVAFGNPDFDVRQSLALHSYMGFVNYLGFPCLVIPIASDERGMPICAQFIARPFRERILLTFASKFELQRFGKNGFTRYFSPTH